MGDGVGGLVEDISCRGKPRYQPKCYPLAFAMRWQVLMSVPLPETSFELVLLESILNECCDLFDRRVNLYRRIVQRLGFAENQDMTSGNLLLRLLPLKDSLQQFEAVVKETRSTLIHLLENEVSSISQRSLLNREVFSPRIGRTFFHPTLPIHHIFTPTGAIHTRILNPLIWCKLIRGAG